MVPRGWLPQGQDCLTILSYGSLSNTFLQIIDAIFKISQRFGVQYRFSCPISQIKLSNDNRTATGVILASGEHLDADLVVCNADLVYAYNNLLPPSSLAESLNSRKASCSSISFYWSLDRVIPELKVHNIFLADEYRESFDSIFKHQTLPDQPSFYVNVPSRVDPTAAPDGKDAIVVLCPVGHLLTAAEGKGLNPQTKQDWDALINKARSAVFDTIESRTGAKISAHITNEIINTPLTWKDNFNLDKGAILGLSHSFFNVLSLRPRTKHASIANLYFVGASTHPGTGVPIVLAGSKVTSEQVLKDYGMHKPWNDAGFVAAGAKSYGQGQKEIDRIHVQPVLSWFHVIVLIVLALFLALYLVGFRR